MKKVKVLGDHRRPFKPGGRHSYRDERDFFSMEEPKEL